VIPPPVLPSGHPLTHIRERFDLHSSAQFPEGLIGECPTAHPETGQFLAEVGADSLWHLSACDFGCSPEVIWESSGVDRQEPGAKDDEALPPPPKTRLNLQPISVLLDEEIPDTEWLFAPYLETKVIAALVAPPNIGKTLLAFWVATQVAAAGKRVAIIEEEGGKKGFQKRISRAVAAVGGREKCLGISYSFKPRISLMLNSDVRALAVELAGYDLVIIDSLARVTLGLEENDAGEMGVLVANMDFLRESIVGTILTLHHTGKAKWKPNEIPRLGDGRGSSAFESGMDTVLALAPVADKVKGLVQFTLHITKQRDEDNQVPPMHVRIAMTGRAADLFMEVPESTFDPLEEMKKEVLEFVSAFNDANGLSKRDINKAISGNDRKKGAAVDALFASNHITKNHLGRYVKQVLPSAARPQPAAVLPSAAPYVVGAAARAAAPQRSFSETEKEDE